MKLSTRMRLLLPTLAVTAAAVGLLPNVAKALENDSDAKAKLQALFSEPKEGYLFTATDDKPQSDAEDALEHGLLVGPKATGTPKSFDTITCKTEKAKFLGFINEKPKEGLQGLSAKGGMFTVIPSSDMDDLSTTIVISPIRSNKAARTTGNTSKPEPGK